MKRIFFLFSLSLLSISGFAQQPAYTLDRTVDNVDCYYSLTQCNGKTVVLLKFNNRNASPVNISWKDQFTTSQIPQKTPGFKAYQIALPPGVSEPADCTDVSHKDFIINVDEVNMTYLADITGFEFSDVSVTQ